VALVGESGCGKSVSALSIMRLLARPAGRIVAGRILFQGRNLLDLTEDEMREIRGRDIAMIFQEPMSSLNPVLTIGFQIMEPLLIHMGMTQETARSRAMDLLKMVGIPDPERRLDQYPHQFSGGMRQRVMIAIALSCNPKLIIADEPTTALDVTIQAQILKLMKDLSRDLGIAMVIITHNLRIVARYANRVNVMYAARLAEQGSAADVFAKPLHPYTAGLLRSVPRLDQPRGRKLETIEGLPPNLIDPPPGCRFAPRCAAKQDACVKELPALVQVEPHRYSACIRARQMARVGEAARPGAPPAGSSRPEDLLRGRRRHPGVQEHPLRGARGGRALLRGVPRRNPGSRGRVGLRQDHGRAHAPEARGGDRRRDDVRGRERHARRGTAAQGLSPQDPGDLPGPVQLAQSPHDDRRDHRRADAGVQARAGQEGSAREGGGAFDPGRALRVHGGALSARALGRTAPAGGDRARARDAALVHRVRRAGFRARCLDPGADH
ncbi:MAG: ABC transporter ATP-binding protein, partial [Betaproteobacteria bacterium]|nr:ABC transporter ATP-binding protein [Betaproteobacteria bacterium]